MNLHGRSLLKEIDFTAEEFRYLIDLGARLRLEKHMGLDRVRPGGEPAAHDQGGHGRHGR